MNHSLTASSPVSKRLSPRKMAFITGTLLLTSTGFICRILGFFYRIFMSRTIGAEGLGIYNMVHPIFSICFAVCAGSIQTALSQYVAANQTRGRAVFRTGLVIAMGMSFLLAWVIYGNAGFLAEKLLLEPRCAPYLPVMAVSVPFAALHACINGYYYGMQKARVPAFSQVAEQVIRMGAVFLIASIWLESGRQITVSLAVYGHLIGEMASAVFTVFCLGFFPPCKDGDSRRAPAIPLSFGATAAPLIKCPGKRGSHMDPQQADELRPHKLRGPVRIRRADQHGPALHPVSLCHHQLHCRPSAPQRGKGSG